MKVYTRFSVCLLTLSVILSPVAPILAQNASSSSPTLDEGFRPEEILDDRDLFELGSMNLERVQDFLAGHGTLGTYRTKDMDGTEKSAAEIIWRVATSYKINPKYLLALMQKEQSLVEDPTPTLKQFDWATGYGVCDNCALDDPAIQSFKGFANQLEWAAKQHREKYLLQILGRGKTIAGYAPGQAAMIDGQRIIPANQATAMLYSYTPHLHGNLNLWRIWQRWFSLLFPDGTIVQAKTSKQFYLLRYGLKRPFKSRAVAASVTDLGKAVLVEDNDLGSYAEGKPIAFANYSLVETPTGQRYLINGQQKRLIASRKVFSRLGFNEDEVIEVKPEELQDYEDGAKITLATAYPTGLLAKDSQGVLWYVEDGVRHLIAQKIFLSLYFPGRPAKLLAAKKLSSFPIGDPYKLHDGELVRAKGQSDVAVIENGQRRPIPSAETFEELGWKWKNVVVLPAKTLESYPVGDPLMPHGSPPIILATP